MNGIRSWLNGLALVLVGGVSLAQETNPPVFEYFQLREPQLVRYRLQPPARLTLMSARAPDWIQAWPENSAAQPVQLGSRVVVQLQTTGAWSRLLAGSALRVDRRISASTFILQAPDAWTALRESQRLGQSPDVIVSHPVRRRPFARQGPYAPRPDDPYFPQQWNYENRDATGQRLGADMNARAAWPYSRGAGVIVAVADDGIELTHPELESRVLGAPHYNFINGTTNGAPSGDSAFHATPVAGLIAAEGYNQIGLIGLAPEARLASWVIFADTGEIPTDEQMMDMFEYQSDVVSVQNHSWGNASAAVFPPSALESLGIEKAATQGRGGLGVVLVHAGGNYREAKHNANDDGFNANPHVIAVGAVRSDGRVASYSNPGACLLIAAPSSDQDHGYPTIVSTDRLGALGLNLDVGTNDVADYVFGSTGFSGTSAATPQIAGLVALMLSANPRLTSRDVQQILILSARHFDQADPDLLTNAAGFRVSHNVGFGVPDAGAAVTLAQAWNQRPPLTRVSYSSIKHQAIPDDALRLSLSGPSVPVNLSRLHTLPSDGPHADTATDSLPLVDVGQALSELPTNLTGKAAFIQRGVNYFSEKIDLAARAGAAFAVIYNHVDGTELVNMADTEFTSIPAVFISQNDGQALRTLIRDHPETRAQIQLQSAVTTFYVPDTLLLEHVQVRVTTDHSRRGDVRVTLLSPLGTRSVLQTLNGDYSAGPVDWTYDSTHHFFESSVGRWTIAISDEVQDNSGSVLSVELILYGVRINDTDGDGLDDDWERRYFSSLALGPRDDPDGDGLNNAREQLLGSNPFKDETLLQLDLSLWNDHLARFSWPGSTASHYEVWQLDSQWQPTRRLATVPGSFPEIEWFTPLTSALPQFFRVKTVPAP